MKKLCSNCEYHNSPSAGLAICGECLNSGTLNHWKERKPDIRGSLCVLMVILAIIFNSWLIMCGIIWLGCLMLGVEFTWGMGTMACLLIGFVTIVVGFSDL